MTDEDEDYVDWLILFTTCYEMERKGERIDMNYLKDVYTRRYPSSELVEYRTHDPTCVSIKEKI